MDGDRLEAGIMLGQQRLIGAKLECSVERSRDRPFCAADAPKRLLLHFTLDSSANRTHAGAAVNHFRRRAWSLINRTYTEHTQVAA
jgi:hypothetical protein